MHVEFLVNGGVSLLLSPENEMEEHLLKQLLKQNNELNEIRSSVVVLNKSFPKGILIAKKSVGNITAPPDKPLLPDELQGPEEKV